MYSVQKSNPINKLTISTEEEPQLYIFEINLNNKIKIRQLVKNRSGFIILNKQLKYKKINDIKVILLDLRLLKEYQLNGNIDHNIYETILSNNIFSIKFSHIEGLLQIFYHINI